MQLFLGNFRQATQFYDIISLSINNLIRSSMSKQRRIDLRLSRWPKPAFIPLFASLGWLLIVITNGWAATLLGLLPAGLMFAASMSILLWSGDRRAPQFLAIGALLGALLIIPLWFAVGFFAGLFLFLASIACWFSAGWIAFRLDPVEPDALTPKVNLTTTAGASVDEAFLCYVINTRPLPGVDALDTIYQESQAALEQYESNQWLSNPGSFHTRPPQLNTPTIIDASHRGTELEFLSFPSEYEPHEFEPGRDRWLSYAGNRTAHATLLRHHDDLPRPWLIGIHGFQMGYPLIDLTIFNPKYYHEELGMNVILPTLPLHGKRRNGRLSGDGFLAGNVMDTIHAEAQAQWDLRRIISWVQQQDPSAMGVLGFSLGGYNTALLSSLVSPDEAEFGSMAAAIPLVDIPAVFWRHGPPHMLRYMDSLGITLSDMQKLMTPVSPVSMPSQMPADRRFIIAASADRVTPPQQAIELWQHWERSNISWYQGSHLTVRHSKVLKDTIHRAFTVGGLLDDDPLEPIAPTTPAHSTTASELAE